MKQGLRYYSKLYFKIIAQDIKSKMQYRTDFYISSIGMIATNLSGLLSFWLLFKSIPDIKGWSYNEMIFLYGFSLLAITPVQIFFDNIWNISHYTLTGDFIKYCFRPINIFFYYISDVFDMKGISQMLFGILTLGYGWVKLGVPLTIVNILLLILALIGASLVMTGIMVLASSSAFWITNSTSVLLFVYNFKDYSKYPMSIFNTVFKLIFSIIIPVGFIAFYPSQLFLRPNAASVTAFLSPLVGAAFFALAYFVWMRGARRYSGTGS